MTSAKPHTIHDGGRYFEGPRWHAGRLWFVDCMERTLLSLAPSGECEQHAKFDDTPCGLGVLPDGRLIVLTMFQKRLLAFSDGKLSLYADLSDIATGTIDDMIVDGLGRAYVGDLGFDLPPPPDRGAPGRIILVMPDGARRVVADGLRFPNGIAASPQNDRLVVAEMDGACLADYDIAPDGGLKLRGRFGSMKSPDGICLDADGAVWVAAFEEDAFIRLDREGRELQRIEVPGRRALACVLGGPEHKTLFCLSAATSYEELRQRKSSSRIDAVEVEIPGAGNP
ncbi:SMP-30/gluconolactonase/LRE family protein [Bradyrhizobium sp. AUGA SZCCT0431]|uniref:SMP-30/gluconolactonase/LRE family protein n=1 Tax=Bradyrhizobium sp. AUGA SZCCT0431 TaxID=2807674 RepID=UPI001BAB03F8|nr:SMP-30/gluconolactonase/LRE family protein [Bradyrhizobium sp. AUGA SZCCT0431]MBR1148393.1 SMP-30/gluconolactonase/LRE family protein [Bradyrhizobium sp. AUGA SZCCT0431]